VAEEQQIIEDENVEVTLDDEAKTVTSEDTVHAEVEASDTSSSSDDELDNYSQKVQKRIKKLTEKYRYAERDKDEASRLAQTLKEENEKLKERLTNLDTGYLNEYGSRLDSQLTQAKAAYKSAHDSGDADALFEAQQALSKIAIEQERYRLAKQRQEQTPEVQPVQETVQQPKQQPVKPDAKAEKWAQKNEWFGEDEIMTQAAFVIHNNLVTEEGFDPNTDEYYDELDKRMVGEFPHKFERPKNEGSPRVASASTSASRSGKQGRRTVKLSHSQVAIAKKLGVPLEEYAKYVKD